MIEIDEILKTYNEFKYFTPSNAITYGRRTENKIVLKNVFIKAVGDISIEEETCRIDFDYRTIWYVKIIPIFLAIFFSLVFILENVTINGNDNPSFLDKLTYVGIGVLLFSFAYLAFYSFKRGFIDKVKKDFDKYIN